MLNSIKMDLYRVLHTKSFYISIVLLLLAFIWMINGEGLVSNTAYASFHRTQDTLYDFLYYFPKSMFFQMAILIFLALFCNEEYNSGFMKNIYPIQSKCGILIERWILSIVMILLFTLICIVVVGIEIAITQPAVNDFSFSSYIIYILMNTFVFSAVCAFVIMIIHLTRNKVVGILVAVGFSFSIIFMLNTAIAMLLPEELPYVEYTLYYMIGNLAKTPDVSTYGKAAAVAISSGILYNIISYLILKKKDLA